MATADQIVNAAVELGEQKSWEAVRLHDVALGGDRVDLLFRRVDTRVGMFVEGRGSDVPPVRLRS